MATELITREMYNGQLKLVHNPNARGRAPRYIVTRKDGTITKPKGVTTILGNTLAKDFVGWALDCMAEYLEPKLPIITKADLEEGKKESARRRDSGGTTGTEAHALVENYLKGKSNTMSTASQEAKNAYNAFADWFEDVTPEVINVEEVIFSNSMNYAGTYDCLLRIDGKVWLCDLKTTNASRKAPNGVYAENFLQLGAYAAAHEEQREFEEKNGGTKLVKIDGLMVISAKKQGKLDIVTNEEVGLSLGEAMGGFEATLGIHNYMKVTTEALGGK